MAKILKNYILADLVLLTSTLLAVSMFPFQTGTRVILLVVILFAFVLLIRVDSRLVEKGTPHQRYRLSSVTFLSLVFLLFPFAMKAPVGSSVNFILDLLSYIGAVLFFPLFIAARLDVALDGNPRLENFLKKFLYVAGPVSLLVYIVVVGIQSTFQHYSFSSEWTDLSFEYAPVYQSLRHGFFRMINNFSEETTLLRYHWPLIYLFFNPLSLIWPSVTMVLWVQVLFFAGSAAAAGVLAYQYLQNRALGWWVVILFTLYLPVHLANLYDFHADPLAMPFVLLSFLFAVRNQWKPYTLMVVLALLCKEYVGLVYAGFGMLLALRAPRAGILTFAGGMLWFLFVNTIGVPLMNNGFSPDVIGMNYAAIGGNEGLSGMVRYIVAHPATFLSTLFTPKNTVAMVSLLLPFMFLPLRSPILLAAGGLIVLKNGLSSYGMELLCHRETLFIPFVIYALIVSLSKVKKSELRFYVVAVSISVSMTFLLQGHAFPARGFWLQTEKYFISSHDRICRAMLKTVPSQSPVMVSSHLSAHVMNRKWYFLFPRFHSEIKPEYIIADTMEQKEWDWLPRNEQIDSLQSLLSGREYELLEETNGVFLFRQKGPFSAE